ncbi:MAG: CrcB family protein [Phycisphaerae bacterium]|nr:CrcB family protein [Phycisphaerae bacterium]
MTKGIWLCAPGALGTIARYGLGGFVQRISGAGFPWGTVAMNLTGCLLFGLAFSALESRIQVRPEFRTIVFIGFFGAFTTFSSFVAETVSLMDDSQWFYAGANLMGQNVLGIAALLAGLALGRML